MKLAVCIINHDQQIDKVIKSLDRQSKKPDLIIVCSDGKQVPHFDREDIISLDNSKNPGRCTNRNIGAKEFLDSECDSVIFIDGDCVPKSRDFLADMADRLDQFDLVYATRQHDIKGKKLKFPPSDLLTVNMDNLYHGKKLDLTDLRVASRAVESFNESETFEERLDLMLTGMIGWSCCFGMTRKGLETHLKFMKNIHGKNELFDSSAFDGSWGYEDVAMGIDALYAGLKITVAEDCTVIHDAHERCDGLFDHVRGRHLIMQRARSIEKAVKVKDKAYLTMMILFFSYIAGIITGLVTGAISLGAIQ